VGCGKGTDQERQKAVKRETVTLAITVEEERGCNNATSTWGPTIAMAE